MKNARSTLLSGASSQHQAPRPKFHQEWVVWAEAVWMAGGWWAARAVYGKKKRLPSARFIHSSPRLM